MDGKKRNSIIESAIIGNIGHILIVFMTGGLMTFLAQFKSLGFYDGIRSTSLVLLFILTLFFWFFMGIRSTNREKGHVYKAGIITGVIAILPAGFFTIISQMLSISTDGNDGLAMWNSFYLVGGPTLFWHRPFSFISELIHNGSWANTSYLIFYINLLLVALAVFLGAIFFGKGSKRV